MPPVQTSTVYGSGQSAEQSLLLRCSPGAKFTKRRLSVEMLQNPIALEQESNGLDRDCSAWPGGDWRRMGPPDSERVSSGDAAGLEHLRGLSSGLNAAC